jgi:hypothetical protein
LILHQFEDTLGLGFILDMPADDVPDFALKFLTQRREGAETQ